MNKALGIILITGALSFGSAWYVQDLRMENQLSNQATEYQKAKDKSIADLEAKLSKQERASKDTEEVYKDVIKRLEYENTIQNDRNIALIDSVSRLRQQERDLRSRIDTLSEQAIRGYAIAATEAVTELSEALRDEQLAHQETSRKAEQFYLGWKALNEAWPRNGE